MQWWACFFFSLLLALVTTVRAEKTAESVVERPELARRQDAEETSSGGAVVGPEGREGRGVVQARTGEHAGRQDVVSMTLNALNPMPYLRGGFNGVREVMNQRFHPFQGMFYRNIPRYNNRFRGGPHQNGGGGRPGMGSGGGQGVKHGSGGLKHGSGGGGFRHGSGGGGFRHGSGGGGFRHGSGGGGGFRHGSGGGGTNMLRNIRGPNNGHHSDNSFGGHHFSVNSDFPGTSNPPHKPFSSDSDTLNGQHFGTPKPVSLMTNTDTQPHHDTNERDSFTLLPESSPPIHTIPADPPRSPDSEGKFTRIINIQVPEEMQNLTILEISMKANGDVGISGGSEGDITRQLSPVLTVGRDAPTTTSSPLSPGWDDVFAEDQRLHGRESTTDLHDLGLITNQESLRVDDSGLVHFFPVNSYPVSPIHDILRMGAAANTNQVLRNGIPLKWQVINNYQPSTSAQSVGLGGHVTQLLQPVIASNPIPSVSKKLISHKQSLRNNIQFVPVIVSPSSQRTEARESVTPWRHQKQPGQNKDSDSPVYYIDITLPGNGGGTPSVSTSRLRRRRRSLEFDGWFPMDVSNPMEDEPTLGYQPPPLQRVRFSNEPVSEKPLYPVVPENPTVFVVRAEPEQPEYHSVYGTENVEYFHINPKSNTVQAFRAPSESMGAIQFVPAPQLSDTSIDTTTMTVEENIDTPSERPDATSNSPIRPAKEDGFADKSDNFAEDDTVSTLTSRDEATHTSKNCESDMEGAFSEIRPSFAQQPYQGPPFRRRYQNRDSFINRQNLRHRPDPPTRRRDNYHDYVRVDDDTTSRPALHELLGNTPRESQIEESPYLGSATDSAKESFFREIPPPDFRYSTRRSSIPRQPPSGVRDRPREAVARRTPAASSHRPWFLIDTRSPNKGRDPSLASYIFPETHAGDEKVHYKPFGPVSYVTKDKTSLDTIHNPHLDDHMNSYKPTLTANSLSELLQIFRFTQVTEESDATEEPVTVREFRYTRPTESPPNSTEILPSGFRYTPSPSKFSDPTTEAGVTEKPPKNFLDAVADTNSLDGYLFSDSEASPEYAHPQVQPNVVKVDGRDETTTKSTTRTTLAAKLSTNLNSKNVRGGMVTPGRPEGLEIIYPGQPQTKKDVTPSPFYVIHQGHSKVRVFGINSSEEKKYNDDTFDDLFFSSTAERPSVRSLPLSATPAQTTSFIPSRGTPSPSTTTTSTSTTTVFPSPSTTTTTTTTTTVATTTTTTLTTAPSTVEEYTTLPFAEAVTEPSPSNVTAQTTTPDSPPVTVTDEYDYFYDGKLEYPDLAFGEDYPSGGQNLPLLRVPSPFSPEPGFPHLALPISVSGLPPTTLAVPDGFYNMLPQTGSPLHHSEAALNLSPAVALTRAELSVARPVFFTKRRADEAKENPQLSQPFEYLSQLRNIETEKQPLVKDTTPKAVPQPRLKRVTDDSGAA